MLYLRGTLILFSLVSANRGDIVGGKARRRHTLISTTNYISAVGIVHNNYQNTYFDTET